MIGRLWNRRSREYKAAAVLLATSTCFAVTSFVPRVAMSWFAHGTSNDSLVDNLIRYEILQTPEIIHSLRHTDRGLFCPDADIAYVDSPAPIGFGATISAPHMHCAALELLKDRLTPGSKALDVGSGSGYLTAAMAHLVIDRERGQGRVVGIDHIPELVNQSIENCSKVPRVKELLDTGALKLVVGDGWQGWADEAPYNAIHVGAAAAHVPDALLQQLAPGGRMVVPVGPEGGAQSLAVIDKQMNGSITRQDTMSVMYVPLTSRERQLRKGW